MSDFGQLLMVVYFMLRWYVVSFIAFVVAVDCWLFHKKGRMHRGIVFSYGEKMTSSFIGSKWLRLWATMNLCLCIALFIYATAHLISKYPELVGLLDHAGR